MRASQPFWPQTQGISLRDCVQMGPTHSTQQTIEKQRRSLEPESSENLNGSLEVLCGVCECYVENISELVFNGDWRGSNETRVVFVWFQYGIWNSEGG